MVDFGDDALTAGRAHPMIDPTLRLEHLARAAADPDTAVLLLDVVLGHGAEPDPAALLAPAIAAVAQPVVVAVVGTDGDPQGLDRQVARAGRRRRRGPPVQRRRHPRAIELWPTPARTPMTTPAQVVTAGADLFADAVAGQAVDVTRVDWRPPMPGTEADLATVAADPLRRAPTSAPSRRCSASPPRWSTSRPRARCSGSSAGSSCTPVPRSSGTARPARCAAR